MAVTLKQIREQHPQYDTLSDTEIADRLYEKHYAGKLDRGDYDQRIGLVPGPERAVDETSASPTGAGPARGLTSTAEPLTLSGRLTRGLTRANQVTDEKQKAESTDLIKRVAAYGGDLGDAAVGGAHKTKLFMDAAGWLGSDDPADADALADAIATNAEASPDKPEYSKRFEAGVKKAGDRFHDAPENTTAITGIDMSGDMGGDLGMAGQRLFEKVSPEAAAAAVDLGKEVVTNPGAVGYLIAEQLPNFLPSAAGGLAGAGAGAAAGSLIPGVGTMGGAIAGGYAGMASGTLATEAGAKVIEMLGQRGVDLRNRDAIATALRSPEFRAEAQKKGMIKGATIAAIDTLTMRMGGRILSRPARKLNEAVRTELIKQGVDPTDKAAVALVGQSPEFQKVIAPAMEQYTASLGIGGKVKRGAAAGAVETIGEGVGEGAGTALAGDDVRADDVVLEMVGGAGQSVAQAAASGAIEVAQNKTLVTKPELAPTEQPSVEELIGDDVEQASDGVTEVDGISSHIVQPESVELAPAPANAPLVDAAAELDDATREQLARPASNIDVAETERDVEVIDAAPAPEQRPEEAWQPPLLEVTQTPIEQVELAPAPPDVPTEVDVAEVAPERVELAAAPKGTAIEGAAAELDDATRDALARPAANIDVVDTGRPVERIEGAPAPTESDTTVDDTAPPPALKAEEVPVERIDLAPAPEPIEAPIETVESAPEASTDELARTTTGPLSGFTEVQSDELRKKAAVMSQEKFQRWVTGRYGKKSPKVAEAMAHLPSLYPDPITAAADEAATSPKNDTPQPTEAQIESGNYRKGHVKFQGHDISIENPVGSTRSGTGPTGKPWSVDMTAHYGYLKSSTGADGEQIDVYLPVSPDETAPVYVVDQIDPKTGKFDESKIVMGVSTQTDAEAIYDAHFSDGSGPKRRQAVTQMDTDAFKAWLHDGDTTKPVGGLADMTADKNRPPTAENTGGSGASPATKVDEKPSGDALTNDEWPDEKSRREARENYDRIVNEPDLTAISITARDLERALNEGARILASEKRKGWEGSSSAPNADLIRAMEVDQDAFEQELRRRGARGKPDLPKDTNKSAAPGVSTTAKIEDFGSVLEGARKHYAAAYADRMREASDVDIAAEPLSKSWPEPDYDKLLESGADPWAVAFVHAERDEIPTKPKRAGKLAVWVNQVNLLRDVSVKILAGEITADTVREKLKGLPTLERNVGGRAELYLAVGHEKSLKGIRIASGSYSVHMGQKFDPPKVMWSVEKRAKATAFSNWPTTIASGESREAAIAAFKTKYADLDTEQKPETDIKFAIYGKRNYGGQVFIGKKLGKHVAELKTFDDVKAARAYMAEHHAELVKLLDAYKTVPNERRQENSPRVGIDHRGGADITPEQFAEAFGFRGVQFGNYVEGAKRQQDLNEAYDALMDMAGIIGVPAKALSLNGELGLAFGARGRGGKNAPSAHYEPGTVVINLTKRSGAGSLAHEWFHGLDNYFSRMRGKSVGYVTEGGSTDGIRPEMAAAFANIRKSIEKTALKQRSKELDKRRSKDYWSTGLEMAARAYESFIIAKLGDQGQANDYLANIVSEESFGLEGGYPYPTAGEIPVIRAAFDEFFQTIESKETEQGTMLFARRDSFAPDPNDDPATAAAKVMAQDDAMFSYPVSDSNDLADIVAKVAPEWTVRREDEIHIISMDDTWAWLMEPGDGTVHVNVAALDPGSGGSQIYHIAANYAYNNGLVFQGDPQGLTAAAVVRRTENMLSSALKFGTTRHIRPADEQNLPWREGDHNLNLRTLMRASVRNMNRLYPELQNLRYNFDTNRVERAADGIRSGQTGRRDERGSDDERSVSAVPRDARAGRRTTTRAALQNTLLSPDGRAVWDGLLAKIGGRPGWFGVEGDLVKAYYASSDNGKHRDKGLSVDGVRAYLEQKVGKVAIKRLLDSGQFKILPSDSSAIPAEAKLAIDSGNIVYGFTDADGTTYLIADNLTDQGTPVGKLEDAYAIFMHEVGVHFGMRDMLGEARFGQIVAETNAATGALGKAVAAARQQVPRGTNPEHVDEEIIAWLVTDRANHKLPLVRRIIAHIRAWLLSKGFTKAVSADALVELARGAAKRVAKASAATNKVAKDGGKFAQRQYTPEQQAAIDAGKFGPPPKEPVTRDAVARAIERVKLRLRQGVVDQFDSFRSVLKDNRTWMMAHLTKADVGALEAVIHYGQPEMVDNALSIKQGSKGLGEILAPLGSELDDFLRWIAGNRADRLRGEGRERLFDQQQIDALKSLNQSRMVDGRDRSAVYETVRQEFEALSDAVVGIAVETGLIAEDLRGEWRDQGHYVPFYRLAEADPNAARGPGVVTGLAKQHALRKLKGADIPLNDLLTNVLLNWHHLLGASLRNQAAVHALKAAEAMGIARYVSHSEKSKKSIWVNEDGQQQWFEFDDTEEAALVLDSLLSLSWQGLNTPTMKIARWFKRALTIGVTVSPEFRIANLLRDSIHSIAVADMNVNIAKNVAEGWRGTKKGSETQVAMLAGGGAFGKSGYIDGADPETIKRLVKRGVDEDTVLTTKDKLMKVWDWYQEWGARSENINRAAAFLKAREQGKDLLEANFEARDLLDFSRTGAFVAVRAIAQVVPFLNARLQGLDKAGRAAMNKKQRAQLAAVVGVYSIASVLLYLLMKDDEDYDEAEEWERDAYHLFKLPGSDVMYRFPRPFEVGTIATVMERITEQVVNDKVHGELFANRLWHAITDTLAFNPIPQAVKPLIEIYSNKNMFTGNPIESMAMERLSKPERKKAWTSETAGLASAAMSKVAWENVQLSPVQIEHLVKAYFGWAGSTILGAVDTMMVRPMLDVPKDPARHLYEAPILQRFVRDNPAENSKYVSMFYDQLRGINQAWADLKMAEKLNDVEKYRAISLSKEKQIELHRDMNKVAKEFSEINAAITQIYVDREMTPKVKREKLNELRKYRNRTAREVTNITGKLLR